MCIFTYTYIHIYIYVSYIDQSLLFLLYTICCIIYSVNIEPIEVAKVTISSLKKLYNALDLNLFASGIKLHYILCPLQRADNVVVTMDGNVDAILASVSILHIPADIFEPADEARYSNSDATTHDDISSGNSAGGDFQGYDTGTGDVTSATTSTVIP